MAIITVAIESSQGVALDGGAAAQLASATHARLLRQ